MRLTKRLDDGQAVMDCKSCELNTSEACTALSRRNRLKDRLAEYEDVQTADDAPVVRHGWWIGHKEKSENEILTKTYAYGLTFDECIERLDTAMACTCKPGPNCFDCLVLTPTTCYEYVKYLNCDGVAFKIFESIYPEFRRLISKDDNDV